MLTDQYSRRAHLLTTCKQAVVALRARALSEGDIPLSAESGRKNCHPIRGWDDRFSCAVGSAGFVFLIQNRCFLLGNNPPTACGDLPS
jgi:hypothetical protein